MNRETYKALEFVIHHATYGGANDKEFWDNIKLVESWIEEYRKEVEE
jgi:hypothetical protein